MKGWRKVRSLQSNEISSKGNRVPKKIVCSAMLCVFATLASPVLGLTAMAAPKPAPTAAPAARASEVEELQAELKTLSGQTPRNEAKIRAINARLAEIEAQRARNSSETGGVATKTTISTDEISSSNAQNTYDAIRNVPGVTQADANSSGGSDNLQIRGIKLGSTTGFRLDGGLSIVNNVILQTEDKAQVQVLKGAGALEYGLASPAGIVNYVLKRAAKNPVNTISFSTNEYGQAIGAVDIGRKFGSHDEFGARLNLAGGDTGSATHGAGGTRYLGALTTDYTSKGTKLRFDFEQFGINIVEQGGLLLNAADKNGHITLARVPDPTQLLTGEWARSVGTGQNLSLRGDFAVDDDITFRAEAGRSNTNRAHRTVSQITKYDLTTGIGTETTSLVRDQNSTNTYEDLELRFKGTKGNWLQNTFVVGYTRNGRDANNPVSPKVTNVVNIYNPTVLPAPVFPTGPITYQPQHSADYDYYFTESATLFSRLRLTGGLRQINYAADDQLAGTASTHTRLSYLAPAIGGTFDVTREVSVYSSYVKSLEETALAPINATNALALLPPTPSTQKELGFRAAHGRDFAMQLGYFNIDRGNATVDPTTKIFALNGTNNFQGLESTLSVAAGPRLSVAVGGQWMHATQHSPGDPTIDGKIPENIPKLSGNLGLTYRPLALKGFSLTAGVQGVGSRQLNAQDQGTLPSVTTYSAGMAYTGKFGGKSVALNLNVKNLTDKSYYGSIANNALGVAQPRTISLTLRTTP
jgi:iron complex outermembrane receptor protein